MYSMNTLIPTSKEIFNDHVLICPACQSSCIHPYAIECRSPGSEKGHVRITPDGIHLDPQKPAIGRGVMITLKFCCECSHVFEYELHFHKGSTFIKRRIRTLKDPQKDWPGTIWRD